MHQLESVPIHLERIVGLVFVPLLLDLSSHSRVPRKLGLGLGAGTASSPLVCLEGWSHDQCSHAMSQVINLVSRLRISTQGFAYISVLNTNTAGVFEIIRA